MYDNFLRIRILVAGRCELVKLFGCEDGVILRETEPVHLACA